MCGCLFLGTPWLRFCKHPTFFTSTYEPLKRKREKVMHDRPFPFPFLFLFSSPSVYMYVCLFRSHHLESWEEGSSTCMPPEWGICYRCISSLPSRHSAHHLCITHYLFACPLLEQAILFSNSTHSFQQFLWPLCTPPPFFAMPLLP